MVLILILYSNFVNFQSENKVFSMLPLITWSHHGVKINLVYGNTNICNWIIRRVTSYNSNSFSTVRSCCSTKSPYIYIYIYIYILHKDAAWGFKQILEASFSSTVTYHPSHKPSQLDKQNMLSSARKARYMIYNSNLDRHMFSNPYWAFFLHNHSKPNNYRQAIYLPSHKLLKWDELEIYVLLSAPNMDTHGFADLQHSADIGCRLYDIPGAITDKDECWKKLLGFCTTIMIWLGFGLLLDLNLLRISIMSARDFI